MTENTRRPDLDRIAKEVKQKHPNWTWLQCLEHAKVIWTAKHLGV